MTSSAALIHEKIIPPLGAIPAIWLARWKRTGLPSEADQLDDCLAVLSSWWPAARRATADVFANELQGCWDIFGEEELSPLSRRALEDEIGLLYFTLFFFHRAERKMHPNRRDIGYEFVDYAPELFEHTLDREIALLEPNLRQAVIDCLKAMAASPDAGWEPHWQAFATIDTTFQLGTRS